MISGLRSLFPKPILRRALWYSASVKSLTLSGLVGVLLLTGCGKSLEEQTREQVRSLANADLPEDSVEIIDVQETGDYAIAEVEIKTAFKLRKEDERWVLEEVRLGDRQWEKVSRIIEALNVERQKETLRLLEDFAEGIAKYMDVNGEVPQAEDFRDLIDLLNPQFVSQAIRLDAWWNPFSYSTSGDRDFELRSAGVDGILDTEDDLVIRKPAQP